jgi:hypothetical protein
MSWTQCAFYISFFSLLCLLIYSHSKNILFFLLFCMSCVLFLVRKMPVTPIFFFSSKPPRSSKFHQQLGSQHMLVYGLIKLICVTLQCLAYTSLIMCLTLSLTPKGSLGLFLFLIVVIFRYLSQFGHIVNPTPLLASPYCTLFLHTS